MLAGYKRKSRKARNIFQAFFGDIAKSDYHRILNRFSKYNCYNLLPKHLKNTSHGYRTNGKRKVNDILKDKKMYRDYSVESDGSWQSSINNERVMLCDPFRCSRAWRFYRKIGYHLVEMRYHPKIGGLHVIYRKNR